MKKSKIWYLFSVTCWPKWNRNECYWTSPRVPFHMIQQITWERKSWYNSAFPHTRSIHALINPRGHKRRERIIFITITIQHIYHFVYIPPFLPKRSQPNWGLFKLERKRKYRWASLHHAFKGSALSNSNGISFAKGNLVTEFSLQPKIPFLVSLKV